VPSGTCFASPESLQLSGKLSRGIFRSPLSYPGAKHVWLNKIGQFQGISDLDNIFSW
jgi:hypothetical protein